MTESELQIASRRLLLYYYYYIIIILLLLYNNNIIIISLLLSLYNIRSIISLLFRESGEASRQLADRGG